MMLFKITVVLVALIIALYDIRERKIKNIHLVILMLLIIAKNFVNPTDALNMLPLLVLVLMLPSYELKWMGAGDIKYLVISGWFFTYDVSFDFYLIVFVLGGLISTYKILTDKFDFKKNKISQKHAGVPYGVGISIALSYFVLIAV